MTSTLPKAALPLRVHVICGGGTGSRLLRLLNERGASLTAGILSEGDTDTETARSLGIRVALAPSFQYPSPEIRREAAQMLAAADAVIVTPFAVGKGNLINLSLASEMPEGVALYLLTGGEFSRRDYTGGVAEGLYHALERRARGRAATAPALVSLLMRLNLATKWRD